MGRISRPAASNFRTEQLRHAKRAQRERERQAGLVNVQLILPREIARKLATARRITNFLELLDKTLDELVVHVAEFPQLRDLAWNRADEYIAAPEAFQLYERNWRFVDPANLEPHEHALIERLKARYGAGVINA